MPLRWRSRHAAPNYAPLPLSTVARMASWGLPVLLLGGVLVVGYLVFRRNPPCSRWLQAAAMAAVWAVACLARSSLDSLRLRVTVRLDMDPVAYPCKTAGSRIMGGVATGLAVGAGVMAAEAIGRKFMGSGEHDRSSIGSSGSYADNSYQPIIDSNVDMGGQNFGIADASWDDGGSAGGGSDWDN